MKPVCLGFFCALPPGTDNYLNYLFCDRFQVGFHFLLIHESDVFVAAASGSRDQGVALTSLSVTGCRKWE